MAVDIATTVKGLSVSIDTIKKLAEMAMKSQNIELQEGILTIREQLLTAKEALLNSKEDILNLKEENSKLKIRIEELEKTPQEILTFQKIGYYTENKDEPFCSRCYEVDNKKVRLSIIGGLLKCSQCKNLIM